MAKDRFTVPLECPNCEITGEAKCEQEDGWAWVKGNQGTYVRSITNGFTRVYESSSWGKDVNFECDECGELCA